MATEAIRLREALGLNTAEMSSLLGVHPTTYYRWEANDQSVKDPLQRNILLYIDSRCKDKKLGEKSFQLWVQQIQTHLRLHGALAGLGALLAPLWEDS